MLKALEKEEKGVVVAVGTTECENRMVRRDSEAAERARRVFPRPKKAAEATTRTEMVATGFPVATVMRTGRKYLVRVAAGNDIVAVDNGSVAVGNATEGMDMADTSRSCVKASWRKGQL